MITKNTRFKLILLLVILLLASALRLWKLDEYPAGLNADEAAIGYNAYSLIQTGKDEHGTPWPIHFKSFGDYKPGLYFYLVSPFVKVLGLNIWAVRLPSAILGILSVWLIYLLVKELFRNDCLALISGFFLAISPWHLHFSRGGWESNVANFFILAGVYLFFKALRKPKLFPFAILPFTFSLYTYHSARLVVPLLVISLLWFYRREIFTRKRLRWIFVAGIVGLILLLPLMADFLGPAGISRFSGVGLFSDMGPFWRVNELRGQHSNPWSLPVRLLHNRLVAYGIAFIENWLDHFHGEFLFLSGDVIERNRIPETGQMYLFDILFVVLGAYFLLKNRPKNWPVVFLWLAISPVAAAMTFQTPHALRANNMAIPLVIISAHGFYQTWIWVKKRANKILVTSYWLLVTLALLWSTSRYLHQYYVHYPKTYPAAWEYGFNQLVDYIKQVEGKYNKIYVTDRYDQPYILFLFYLRYPPQNFQKEVKLTPRDKFGFSTVRDFDKFHFEAIKWDEVKNKTNVLIVGTSKEIPQSAKIIKTIYFKNEKPVFQIAET